MIAFHPNNKCGVATQSFIVKPDKAPQPLQYQLMKTYSHATDASTQGLVYIDGIIYEGTGIKGQSTLRKIDLENNKTLAMLGLDSQYFGEGITRIRYTSLPGLPRKRSFTTWPLSPC